MEENTKKTLSIYLEHINKYRFWGCVVLFSVVGGSAVSTTIPIYYKKFFDVLTGSQTKDQMTNALISVLISILVLEFFAWIFWRIATFSSASFQTHIIADLADTCFKYLHKHSFSFFNNNFTGSLIKRVSYFTRSFEEIADRITWNFLPLTVNVIIITTVMLMRSAVLGGVIIIWLLAIVAINWFVAKYKLKYDIQASAAQTEATGFLSDTVINNSNVKLFCGYKRETDTFRALNEKLRKVREFSWNLNNIFEAVQTCFGVALEIGAFYIGIKLWEKGQFTIGDFVLLQSYLIIIFHNVWSLGKMIRDTYRDLADAEEMTVMLIAPHEIEDTMNAKPLKVIEGKIEFKKVDFYYQKTRKILGKFNLIVAPRERVALIGPSGAGKTTVIKLLLRNHDVAGGKILIDGQDISHITQESLWKNISLVPQDPILFHRTLLENIRYGKPDATDEEVIRASKLAHCHEFISTLPEKYDTYVGERGVKLSGGERQRVAIARAILRNSPILVLDEATSSLDSNSENLIQDALGKLMEEKTVIVIAHRLSTIVKMNRIIFIDGGEIKESGTHTDLIAKDRGQYRKLWELQACGFIAE